MKPNREPSTKWHVVVVITCTVLVGCGGEADEGGDVVPAGCTESPMSIVPYATAQELESLLVRCWQRCGDPQIAGEEVGVEFTADGRYYALARDRGGEVTRVPGIDYGGTWSYGPPGSVEPGLNLVSEDGYLLLDAMITSPPIITDDPRQLRILFTPVLGKYVPLEP
jgi:hypothetical protein